MKVLHINCNYMGTVLHQVMIEHLNTVVEYNRVFCPIYNGSVLATKPNDYVAVSNCFNKYDRYFFFHKQSKIIKALEKSYDVNQFDIIHAYTLFTDGNCAYELHKKYGKPYVVAIRATDLEFFKYRINLRNRGFKILQNADKIFFLSSKIMDNFINKYIPQRLRIAVRSKAVVIPNGIDDFWLENKFVNRDVQKTLDKFRNKKIDICCVAQIIKRKNIPLLQTSINYLKSEGWDVHLTVIGKAVDKNEYNTVIANEFTTYVSPIPKEELIKYYRNSDVFVLPSVGETFGLVYAEAMSQGLPVVYTAGEGFDGQFEEGVVGYSVDVSKSINISKKITEICSSYNSILNNIVTEVDRYNWIRIVKIYEEIYITCLSNHGGLI